MNSPGLLPLRIPELGPSLGKLVTGTGNSPGGLDLSAIRYGLITRLMDSAGEARRLAAADERSAAIFAISPVVWMTAWEEASTAVSNALLAHAEAAIEREADVVRMPAKTRQRFLPTPADRRALAARIGSAGSGLVPVLDELERRGAQALSATEAERDALEAWHEAVRGAARRLEEAWLILEERVAAEASRWDPTVRRVRAWRRPLTPVLVVGTGLLLAGTWLGLALGGFIPAPAFLRPLLVP